MRDEASLRDTIDGGLLDRVWAVLSALALEAVVTDVELVDPLDERLDEIWFVGEDPGFEVSPVGGFGT